MEVTVSWVGVFLWNWIEVLVAQHCECASIVHFKMINFMSCELHLRKKCVCAPDENKTKMRKGLESHPGQIWGDS